MISIFIATAVSLYREGLLHVCNEKRGLQVISSVTDTEALLRSCRGGHPNVVILDSALPGHSTPALLRRLHQEGCETQIVLFGAFTAANVQAAMRLNTKGLLSSHDDGELFVRAAHAVHSGLQFHSQTIVALSACAPPTQVATTSSIENVLTPTELQIFHALSQNRTSQEIAASMFISYRTVQKHRSNMTVKLKLCGSNALLAFAMQFRG